MYGQSCFTKYMTCLCWTAWRVKPDFLESIIFILFAEVALGNAGGSGEVKRNARRRNFLDVI